MKRIALLGATGSIGRQAIEVIDAHPELELVAAASGSQPIDGLAPLTQVGGDLDRAARARRAGRRPERGRRLRRAPPTMWALEHGVTLALANKESLVAAGELALAAQRRGGGELIPVDSEHSALFQCLEGRAASGRHARADRQRRPVPRPHARRARGRHAGGGARAPDLDDGPEDHDRLGDAREQGPRGDRGALPLRRPVRPDRGRGPPAVDRPRARPLPRRRRDRAPRQPGHARADLVRAHLPGPRRDAACRRSSSGARSSSEAPDPTTFPMLALAREAGERGGTYPCAYNAANEVAVAAFLDGRIGFLDIADAVEDVLARVDGAPARDLDELVEADARARASSVACRMSVVVAILGLAVPDPRPRGGPLLRRARRRDAAAEVLPRLPAGAREDERGGVEYGIGAIPLGGYVKIPGMHRPAPGDLRARSAGALQEQPELAAAARARSTARSTPRTDAAQRAARAARAARGALTLRRGRRTRRPGARGRARARRVLAPDDLEAGRRDRGGPGGEHRRRARRSSPSCS